jgi:probable rRNA maturation factor
VLLGLREKYGLGIQDKKMLNIYIINQSKNKSPRMFIKLWLAEVIRLLPINLQKKLNGKNLNIVFLDQVKAKKMNLAFRGKNYATDILSFGPIEAGELGELVLCPQVIERQAKDHGLSVRAELGYMLIHGCLHLLGFDHEQSEKEAKRMFRLQDRIFAQMTKKAFTSKE